MRKHLAAVADNTVVHAVRDMRYRNLTFHNLTS